MRPLGIFAALISLAGSLLTTRTSFAQDPPATWGEIPKADLAMQSYPADMSAEALVLSDYGESAVNNDLGVTFTRHLRIKIFTSAGYEWGTRVLSLYTGDHEQELKDLEGVTYSLGSGGEIVKTELDDESVFEEKVDKNITRYRYTMPALKPGCIFEIRYRIEKAGSYTMRPWVFQCAIPTVWSEYRAIAPYAFSYARVTHGYESFSVDERTETFRSYMGDASVFFRGPLVRCAQYRWVMRDVPALREEPYVKTMSDYAASVQVQLAEYTPPRGGSEKILLTWEDLVENLLQRTDFGRRIDPPREVRRTAERVTAGWTTPLEKLTALYDFVRSAIVWDGKDRMWPSADAQDLLNAKKGNSADITFLLLSLLRSVDLEAYPAILSTRSNGEIVDVFPLVNQFDYVVARVTAGGNTYYLDATDPMRTFDLLPTEVLNVRALIVKQGPVEWVRLTTLKGSIHSTSARLAVSQNGEMQGTFQSVDQEYSALARRRDLQEKKPVDVAKEVFGAERTAFTLDSVTVSGQDSMRAPLIIAATAVSASYAQVAGDHIYINPALIDRMASNPFTLKVRKFPVDMSYPRNTTSFSSFRIPEGYVAKEFPRNVSVDLGLSAGSYSRKVSAEGNDIRVESRFVIQRTEFPRNLYNSLKDFYDRVVAAEGEQIVLERKPPAPAKGTPAPPPRKGKGRE